MSHDWFECLGKQLAQILHAHSGSSQITMCMYDIHDSPAWKLAYSADEIFEGDQRGLFFAFCTDGINPFSHNCVAYSMWPIMLSLLNLPRHMCNLFSNIFLLRIIPGNESQQPKP